MVPANRCQINFLLTFLLFHQSTTFIHRSTNLVPINCPQTKILCSLTNQPKSTHPPIELSNSINTKVELSPKSSQPKTQRASPRRLSSKLRFPCKEAMPLKLPRFTKRPHFKDFLSQEFLPSELLLPKVWIFFDCHQSTLICPNFHLPRPVGHFLCNTRLTFCLPTLLLLPTPV